MPKSIIMIHSSSQSHLIPLDFKSLHTLPDSHTWSHHHHHHPSSDGAVPVIDLSDPNAKCQVRRACENWGVFQVTNHGVSTDLMKQAEHQARRLFGLPRDRKLRALRLPDGMTGYGSARISKNFPKLMWSEGFTMMGSSVEDVRKLWPRSHGNFCDIMEEYQKEMKGLATKMVGLMLESLGLSNEDLQWLDPQKQSTRFPQALLHLNSYPACPDPDRAMGLAPHTDSSLLTLLNQSTTSGLQVLVDGGSWVPVHPTPGALIVNVGDLMHILSNGRFKSVLHRAVVNKVHHRISIAYFYGPPFDVMISPLIRLIDRNHPPLYRPVTWKEFLHYKATQFNKAFELIRNTNGC